MNTPKKDASNHAQSLRRAHSELLERALQQPGVREMMAVYEEWRKVDEACQPHRGLMAVKRVISASDASRPAFQPIP